MSKKNNWNKLLRSNKKERYKSYKSGKNWVYAMITTYGGVLGVTTYTDAVSADDQTGENTATETDTSNVLAVQDSAKIPSMDSRALMPTTNTLNSRQEILDNFYLLSGQDTGYGKGSVITSDTMNANFLLTPDSAQKGAPLFLKTPFL